VTGLAVICSARGTERDSNFIFGAMFQWVRPYWRAEADPAEAWGPRPAAGDAAAFPTSPNISGSTNAQKRPATLRYFLKQPRTAFGAYRLAINKQS
jgi:hypothetical protein